MQETYNTEVVEDQQFSLEELIEDTEKQIAIAKATVADAEGLAELRETETWKKLFDEGFVAAYNRTALYNMALFKGDTLEGATHHLKARSIFVRYCDGIIEMGVEASTKLQDLYAQLDELLHEQEAGAE